ncbi:PREDICTED: uncharacterized protein LOC106820057, partial [Priapulus caudatus]|uniref:Uncharacterized protein LOC106820057 n=1 Tax=Priapulus caudatus TaxID=37621 RepID=A0ABM1F6N0_PRICU
MENPEKDIRLKRELARRERYDRLLEAVLEYETRQDVSLMRTSLHESFPDISIETRDGLRNPHSVMASDAARRDKSLGILSQKFLMLFLVSEVGRYMFRVVPRVRAQLLYVLCRSSCERKVAPCFVVFLMPE